MVAAPANGVTFGGGVSYTDIKAKNINPALVANFAGTWDGRQKEASAVVDRALQAGINFLDTSDVYSRGASEKSVGQALKDVGAPRKDVVIATKVGSIMGDGPNDKGSSRGHIMDSVAQSLERLQTDHIDLGLPQ